MGDLEAHATCTWCVRYCSKNTGKIIILIFVLNTDFQNMKTINF